VTLVADDPIVAPRSRLPDMLRGAFEISFRRMVCQDVALDCRACPLVGARPYPAVFKPAPPPGS
jgi:hypothetical protein